MLSLGLKTQTSKNVADTTFNKATCFKNPDCPTCIDLIITNRQISESSVLEKPRESLKIRKSPMALLKKVQ